MTLERVAMANEEAGCMLVLVTFFLGPEYMIVMGSKDRSKGVIFPCHCAIVSEQLCPPSLAIDLNSNPQYAPISAYTHKVSTPQPHCSQAPHPSQ